MRTLKIIFTVLFFCFFVSPPLPLWSATIRVSPMVLELSPENRMAVLNVMNGSDEPVVLQMETKEWKQEGGNDLHTSSRDVILTPPLVKIGPQDRQIVRLSSRNMRPSSQETAYRLFLREVPQPASKQGVQTVLNISLPLFVKPNNPVKSKPTWSVSKLGNNQIRLTLLNKGNAHIKVTNICLHSKKGKNPLAEKKVLDYVLPTNEKWWEFTLPASYKNRDIVVSAETNEGKLSECIQLPGAVK